MTVYRCTAPAAHLRAATPTATITRRRPGAHREPGSNPWRTGWREFVATLTRGRVRVYRPCPPAHA